MSTLVAAALLSASLPARALDKAACVSAAEAAQHLKKQHKLVAAHEQLLVCSSPDCPSIVSNDCTSWLGEVERSMASVVVKARDGKGTPLYDVRVLLDGAPFAPQASGAPLDVDPGDHVFRCERGTASVEVKATIGEGERGHVVQCDLPGAVAAAPPNPVDTRPPAPNPLAPTPADEGGLPWPTWVLGGVGVLAAGSAAIFGALELNQQQADAAPGGCKPNCSSAEISSIQTKIDVTYVSIGVAVVAVGAAVAFALLKPHKGGVAGVQLPTQTLPLSPW